MKRCDYKENLKWDTTALYKDSKAFDDAYNELQTMLEKYKFYEGHILDSAQSLYEFLNFDMKFSRNMEQIIVYAQLKNDEDTSNSEFQTLYGRVMVLFEQYHIKCAFVVPELLKSKMEVITNYIKEEPRLKEYERSLKEIFKYQKHTLSSREEKVLSSLTGAFMFPNEVYSLLTDTDLKFGKVRDDDGKLVELTEKNYRLFSKSDNRSVRKTSFKKLYQTYANFKNTYAALLSSEVKNNNKQATLRKYPSALNASLYAFDIPEDVYTTLIKEVRANIAPLSRYWKLKREALGLDKLHLYDTGASIVKDIKKKYSVEDAQKLIQESLSLLGDKYVSDINKAFKEHWIDFCPNDAKRNGGYCTCSYNVHPYILLSYNEDLENVSTLIHELGHAMHYYYAQTNQKYQDYGYSIFVAEVASQVNQILLSKYLINKTKDREEKKYLIDDLIQDFKAAVYRQTMFAEFEKEIHEYEAKGGVLTNEVMNDMYYKLNKHYFGKNIIIDKEIQYEWMRIPHFYMNFYVYQYATSYMAAIKIAMDILKKKDGIVDKYLEFLSLGSTKDPISSLKVAGVDMLDGKTMKEAFTYFDDLVTELENLEQEGED